MLDALLHELLALGLIPGAVIDPARGGLGVQADLFGAGGDHLALGLGQQGAADSPSAVSALHGHPAQPSNPVLEEHPAGAHHLPAV